MRGGWHHPLVFLCALAVPGAPWAACPTDVQAPLARVNRVTDGDTLVLENQTKIRLLGLNAPEISHPGKAGEPLGEDARSRLQALVAESGQRVRWRTDEETTDRYGRRLAFLYSPDGRDLGERLLEEGLAWHIVVPPNTAHDTCLREAEDRARTARRGVWAQKNPVPSARSLGRSTDGFFRLVSGTVTRIVQARQTVGLEVDNTLMLWVHRDDLPAFGGDQPDRWAGRRVEARGWLQSGRDGPRMTVRHPAMLHRVN
ncbi:MAG: thermonuclease family protein [Pseudomonadota bacterium]